MLIKMLLYLKYGSNSFGNPSSHDVATSLDGTSVQDIEVFQILYGLCQFELSLAK